jgi:hypothetical protein
MNLIFALLLWVLMPTFIFNNKNDIPKEAFFHQLSQLFGKSFPGHIAFPEGNDATLKMSSLISWKGKPGLGSMRFLS